MTRATISDFLRNHAVVRPDRAAYIYCHGDVTWGELDRRVDKITAGLYARGIRAGDVVAVCVTDGPVQIEMLYAAARLGAIRVGLNYRFASADIVKLIAHSGARLVVAETQFIPLLSGSQPDLGIVDGGNGQDHTGAYRTLLESVADAVPAYPADAPFAQICYTTGSTGNPKGALWRHAALLHAIAFTALELGFREEDVFLHCLPAAGVPSIAAIWNCVLGFTTVVVPRFQTELVLDMMAMHGCTTTLLVPTMLTELCEAAEARPRDLSRVRRIYYGSAPTTPALIRRGMRIFQGVEFEQIYGSTEGIGGWYTKLTPADHLHALAHDEALLASCGRPMAHCQVQIIDDKGEPAPAGEIGEIRVRGDFVMDGYHHDEVLTRKTLRDGWLVTGDIGRLDKNGYLYIVDRKQFMIITGGYNVYPVEIENVIAQHPSVLEVSVFGVPDEKWGEAIHAAVVLRRGCADDSETIRAWCHEKLARFKIPKSIEIRDQLIRGATGKIQKRAERDRFMALSQ